MIRKYHNHKLQTNMWHGEEEQNNNHETSGRQTKLSIQLSLFPIKIIAKLVLNQKKRTIKHRTIPESHNVSNNQQRIINSRTIAIEQQQSTPLGA